MRGFRGQELLRRPVRIRGIQLGRAVDLILDPGGQRVLGFDVLCGDGAHRFLPIAAAEPSGGEISVRSSLTLLDPDELAFYRERGTTLTALRERELDDVVLDDDGGVTERVPKVDGDPAAA
jgi:hypothetical protein